MSTAAAVHPELRIIDNYYIDPFAVREAALLYTYTRPETGTWNGLHSIQRHPDTEEHFFALARMIDPGGQPNWDQIQASYQFWSRPSAGLFALLLEGQSDNVHYHLRSGARAAVCYFSLPRDCDSRDGVSFYRHRASGLVTCQGANISMLQQLKSDGPHRSRWEKIATVPMSFNRMIIFDARCFHAASDGFGTSILDGRLAQIFNIDFL
jgi:hypothetical protein